MMIARKMISSKAEYACLALIDLARSGLGATPKRIRAIADAQGIPRQYLTQILLRLKAAGLVQSARGSIGGYQLARSPEGITVAEVLVAIDGCDEPSTRRHSATNAPPKPRGGATVSASSAGSGVSNWRCRCRTLRRSRASAA